MSDIYIYWCGHDGECTIWLTDMYVGVDVMTKVDYGCLTCLCERDEKCLE